MDSGRLLEPVRALGRSALVQYEGREELAAAVRDAAAAVERSLRLMLRADTGAPDELRMAALSSSDLSFDRVLGSLREREWISLTLAGRAHELAQAGARAATGEPQAADADLALAVLDELEAELHELSDRTVREAAHHTVEEGPLEPTRAVPPPPGGERRRLAFLAAVLLLGAGIVVVLALVLGGGADLEDGIAAFERGEQVQAGVIMRAVLEEEPENVTALLYLARIERRAGRHTEAAEYLQRAAGEAPADADVRRELGHLFMELGRPTAAAEHYARAVEIEPGGTLGWIGWIRALRAAGDTARAEGVLRRAPEEARSALQGG